MEARSKQDEEDHLYIIEDRERKIRNRRQYSLQPYVPWLNKEKDNYDFINLVETGVIILQAFPPRTKFDITSAMM